MPPSPHSPPPPPAPPVASGPEQRWASTDLVAGIFATLVATAASLSWEWRLILYFMAVACSFDLLRRQSWRLGKFVVVGVASAVFLGALILPQVVQDFKTAHSAPASTVDANSKPPEAVLALPSFDNPSKPNEHSDPTPQPATASVGEIAAQTWGPYLNVPNPTQAEVSQTGGGTASLSGSNVSIILNNVKLSGWEKA